MNAYTGPTWNKRHGVYFIKYRTLDGKRSTKNVPAVYQTEEAARAWADKAIVYYRNTGKWVAAAGATSAEPVTIRSLHQKWLKFREVQAKTSATTLAQFESNMRLYILTDPIADQAIETLTPKVLRAWVRLMSVKIAGKTGKKIAANTAKNIVATLTRFFRDARAESWIELDSNPMKDEMVRDEVPPAINVAGKGVVVHVPREDLIVLLRSDSPLIPPQRKMRHVVACTTGAREGEISALAWHHVRLTAEIPHVEIERQLTTLGAFEPPKRDSYRTLPLHPASIKALAWWRSTGWALLTGREPTDEDPVFPSTTGAFFRPRAALQLRHDLGAAGVAMHYKGHPMDAHALRRSFATMLADAEVPEDVRAILMGHASKTVTDRHYTARNLGRFVGAVAKVDLGTAGWVEPVPPTAPNLPPKRRLGEG
jgi:integrase